MSQIEKLEIIDEQSVPNPLTNGPITNDTIFELLFKEEDLTWQTLLYELVKTNKMDPWDIDISVLTKKFIGMIKKLKELDFRISGKVVLASAILLKIKSNRFISEDVSAFDSLLNPNDNNEEFLDNDDGYLEYGENDLSEQKEKKLPRLFPRTPQPRKRKVSIFDLVNALEKALQVKNRRSTEQTDIAANVKAPINHREISFVIKDVYNQIKKYFQMHNTLKFTELLPSEKKEDKILTFVPLLHLRNQQKVELHQKIHFGEIDIELLK